MAVHRVTRILPYAPDQLAALVADVRAYPEFVPWVTSMRAWGEREESSGVTLVDAEASVGFSKVGLRHRARRFDDETRRI